MSSIAPRSPGALMPLDARLPAEVRDWVSELRVIWAATGLSLNQFRSINGHGDIDKGTISRYLNGRRVPSSSWFLDKLTAIQAKNGRPLTPAACEHLAALHMRALQVAHPHEYRVRLISDELEIALIGKEEAERYARALEERLAERSRQIDELTDDQGRLRAAWDADRAAAQADYERLTQEIDEIAGQLHLARGRTIQAEQRCKQLEGILDQLDVSVAIDEDSVREFVTTMAHEPDGVVVANELGHIIVFNRAASRLTGLDPADVTGKFVFDALPLHDSEGRDWWVYTDPYHGLSIRTRHPERALYLANGTEVLVSVGYVRDRDLDQGTCRSGSVRRLVISLRDAEHRKRLERSQAQLVYTVAHELRSPLTTIKGFTATLLNKWPRFTDDQKLVMVETVNADADRVTRLITELLDVSRIDGERVEIHRQLVDLPDRARKIIAGRVAAGDAEERFRLEVRGDLPETWLDADKIDQILDELVENAIRHGAGLVTIVIEPTHLDGDEEDGETGELYAPDAAVISVRDQGKGIAPELALRVFRQFWRVKRRGGSGLGLYIVKGLVEAHGGTIGVQSAPGGGAEFRFIVPARPVDI
jgi:PAS domain S-box-containing protein